MSLVVWLVFGAVEAAADDRCEQRRLCYHHDFVQQVGETEWRLSLVPALADPRLGANPSGPVSCRYSSSVCQQLGCKRVAVGLVRSPSQSNLVVVELSAGLEPAGPSHSVHSDHRHDLISG